MKRLTGTRAKRVFLLPFILIAFSAGWFLYFLAERLELNEEPPQNQEGKNKP
ncbi:MAG: hypothetical protein LBI79_02145 [Nitrososphaerota archaeon]|jgi:hypothetical protein|nr:hypothetical protein [Nitrososphaerota archaeon]